MGHIYNDTAVAFHKMSMDGSMITSWNSAVNASVKYDPNGIKLDGRG